jgi:pimeloyl-ACP methyl ester carboxylesterase
MKIKIQLLALLALVPCTMFGQNPAGPKPYSPKGRLVDVGGRKLHILQSGQGSPTVILVAGGSAFAVDWTLVQSRIDSNTRVCSYDRAGYGWSDPGPAEETVEEEVSDLHKLLLAAHEKGPYILVGASIGGIYIQAYQHTYPKEVAGLVFTNSSNMIGFPTKTRTALIWDLTPDEIIAAYPFPLNDKKHETVIKAPDPYDHLPQPEQNMRIWLTERLMEKWDTTRSTPESTLSWRKEFLREFAQSDAERGRYPLKNLPVIVVSSDPKTDDSLRYSKSGAAGRLDFLSSNTIHITAAGSGHEIHLYQPDKVVEAIRLEIAAIRKRWPLATAAAKQP